MHIILFYFLLSKISNNNIFKNILLFFSIFTCKKFDVFIISSYSKVTNKELTVLQPLIKKETDKPEHLCQGCQKYLFLAVLANFAYARLN